MMYLQLFSFFLQLSFTKEKSLLHFFFFFFEKEPFQATFFPVYPRTKFLWLFSSTSFLLRYKRSLHANSISPAELLPEGNVCCSDIPFGQKDEEVNLIRTGNYIICITTRGSIKNKSFVKMLAILLNSGRS